MWYFRTRANTCQNDILSAQSDSPDLPSLLRPASRSMRMLNQVSARQTCYSVYFSHAAYSNATRPDHAPRPGIGTSDGHLGPCAHFHGQYSVRYIKAEANTPYHHEVQATMRLTSTKSTIRPYIRPQTCTNGTRGVIFGSSELALVASTAQPQGSRSALASTVHDAPLKLSDKSPCSGTVTQTLEQARPDEHLKPSAGLWPRRRQP